MANGTDIRNAEPAVVGRGGEVRRVRSVLDMRLGPLASSPDRPLCASWADAHIPPCDENNLDVDIFGLPIPSTSRRDSADGGKTKKDNGKTQSGTPNGTETPNKETRQRSLLYADSPSRLDLSALLC